MVMIIEGEGELPAEKSEADELELEALRLMDDMSAMGGRCWVVS